MRIFSFLRDMTNKMIATVKETLLYVGIIMLACASALWLMVRKRR